MFLLFTLIWMLFAWFGCLFGLVCLDYCVVILFCCLLGFGFWIFLLFGFGDVGLACLACCLLGWWVFSCGRVYFCFDCFVSLWVGGLFGCCVTGFNLLIDFVFL